MAGTQGILRGTAMNTAWQKRMGEVRTRNLVLLPELRTIESRVLSLGMIRFFS